MSPTLTSTAATRPASGRATRESRFGLASIFPEETTSSNGTWAVFTATQVSDDPRAIAADAAGNVYIASDSYSSRGDYDKAAELYRQVMKLKPADPRPYFLLGATYVQAGRDAKAETVFEMKFATKTQLSLLSTVTEAGPWPIVPIASVGQGEPMIGVSTPVVASRRYPETVLSVQFAT